MTKTILVFAVGIAFTFFVYWVAGGEFDRSAPLAITVMLSPLVGLLCVLFAEIAAFMFKRGG